MVQGSQSRRQRRSKAYKSPGHVLDRFHVIRWFSAGLTAVRRDIQRRPEGSKPAFDPEVF